MEKRPKIKVQDLGLMDYKEAWDLQYRLHNELIENKLSGRSKDTMYFLLCEHPPVYTLGRSGSPAHLLLPEAELKRRGLSFYKINRGGDITHHGPGQLVGYPILDLSLFREDVGWYIRSLEEVLIRTVADFGVEACRIPKYTGVWVPGRQKRKIAAIGVHLSRWVSMHGFALNVSNDLSLFDHIIPCGIQDPDKAVTSLSRETGQLVEIAVVKEAVLRHFAELFSGYAEVEKNTTHEEKSKTR